MNQKGFASIILIIVVVALAGTGLYFALSHQTTTTPSTVTSPSPSPTTITTTPTPPTSQSNLPKIVKGHSSAGKSIKAILVHDISNPHALNNSFLITSTTHISISLYYAPYADGGSETILSQDFTNIDKLPFLFEITGNLDQIFKERTGYYLKAKVFDHPGSEVVVGDLISEILTPIASSDSNIEIKVFGIEKCGSPNAGGFCTTKK